MADITKPYKGVAYFGLWAVETADDYGKRDALAVLHDAVEATQDRDLRHNHELIDVLDYLTEHSGSRAAVSCCMSLSKCC